WFREKNDKLKENPTVRIQLSQPLSGTGCDLGLQGSVKKPFWIYNPIAADLVPLSGYWVSAAALALAKKSGAEFVLDLLTEPEAHIVGTAALIKGHQLCDSEERFGIALESVIRRVKEGHLFASQHIRLKPGVQFLVGLMASAVDDFADQGILQLGGEQRICSYCKVNHLELPESKNSHLVMSLSPTPVTELAKEFFEHSWAGGKLLRVGGWDMRKGFHKEMVTYYPAGTVFQVSEKVVLPTGFIRL
ncbi:MAG: type III-B CRISPR module-associated Cmr3 family protein, partial [Pseudomonadota bacterium]|nr:type III-B CRISPR module-associated Cmr3 family protein [Pseudomonadota bacterium]